MPDGWPSRAVLERATHSHWRLMPVTNSKEHTFLVS